MTSNAAPELERFFELVRQGDHAAVRAALETDPALVDAFDPNPWCCRGTPLGIAAGRGDLAMVDVLLEAGADIDRKSDWWAGGFAPIHSLPRERRDELARALVERGATVDVHAAAMLGWAERLAELLDAQPFQVNAPGGDGARPLHVAADRAVAELLLEREAWLEPRDVDHGSTPAEWAARERPDVAALLLERGAEGDVFMYTAMGDAARVRSELAARPSEARAVLSRGRFPSPGSRAGHIYVYTLGGYGSSVLHVAAAAGEVEVLRALVDAGADPGARGGYDDAMPLHVAAWNGQLDAIDALVDAGAELEAPSGPAHENTPAGWAIVNGQVAAVERLLGRGAQVQPWYEKSARRGLAGEFRAYSRGTADDFERILGLLAGPG